MKKTILLFIGSALLALPVLIISCSKAQQDGVAPLLSDFSNKAVVQVIIATANASKNYIYVDGKPVTGSVLSSGSIFPTAGAGFSVDGGVKNFLIKDTTPTTLQVPLSFAENLDASGHYTIFAYDTISAPKQKIVKDNIVIPTDTSSRIRFANFGTSPTAVPAVDIFSFNRQANIFTNIPVTGVTDFIPYPSRLPVDTLYIRETGTTNLVAKTSISVLTPKRSYTFVLRGSYPRGTYAGTRVGSLYATY